MAVETGLIKQAYGVTYTVRTADSADWPSVANSTRFYDIADDVIYFKDSLGNVISLFESGSNIYTANGTLTGARTVTMAGNDLAFKGASLVLQNSSQYGLNFRRFDDASVRSSILLGAGSTWTGHGASTQDLLLSSVNSAIELKAGNGGEMVLSSSNPRVIVKSQFLVTNATKTAFQHRLYDNSSYSYLCAQGGDLGVGFLTAPTAKLHVKGADLLQASSSLLVESSTVGDTLLDVRNNGQVTTNGTPRVNNFIKFHAIGSGGKTALSDSTFNFRDWLFEENSSCVMTIAANGSATLELIPTTTADTAEFQATTGGVNIKANGNYRYSYHKTKGHWFGDGSNNRAGQFDTGVQWVFQPSGLGDMQLYVNDRTVTGANASPKLRFRASGYDGTTHTNDIKFQNITDNAGNYELQIQDNANASLFTVKSSGVLNMPSLPTYADDTAAGAGGLLANDVYKTATGELRIKL